VTSRADVHAKVVQEIRAAGPADRAETIARLPYLHACLLETGRLFPPVTRTFHRKGADASGAGREIVHYFPLLQRDDLLGPTVHEFRPERWLAAPRLDAAAAASNLFLRGPRACPGMDLILFVCTAAAARLLGELGLSGRDDRLARDPLPLSFPKTRARFTAPEGMS
jgi:cytochrome P450